MQLPPESAPQGIVVLGRIIGLYGVRGWVKVHSDTSPRDNIVKFSRWWIRQGGDWQQINVQQGRPQGKTVIAQLDGVADREQAATLIGADIGVQRNELPSLEEGYYWTDLIGCQVNSVTGDVFGTVSRLFETGANDVMVVQRAAAAEGGEILIPWLRPDVITQVDLDARVITVDWDPDY